MLTAEMKDYAGLRRLVADGADIDLKNADGWTILHGAARDGDDELVQVYAELEGDMDAKNNAGETALHIAAKDGDHTTLVALIANKADALSQNDTGKQALQLAKERGHEDMVDFLSWFS